MWKKKIHPYCDMVFLSLLSCAFPRVMVMAVWVTDTTLTHSAMTFMDDTEEASDCKIKWLAERGSFPLSYSPLNLGYSEAL